MKRSKRFGNLFYIYWPITRGKYSYGEFAHPEIRVYRISEYRPEECSPDSVIDFQGQNDQDRGWSIYQTYALRADLNMAGHYGTAPIAIDLLRALGIGSGDGPVSILGLAKKLIRLGIQRRVLVDVVDERGQTDKKFIPIRHRQSAGTWYQAAIRGLELTKKTA